MSRRSYDRQFKIAAVKLVLEDSMSVSEVAKELSIHYNSLYRWISEYEEYGESAFPGHGSALYNSQYEIKKIFEEHKGRYDSIRISKVLKQQGITVNRKRVSRLMRNMKLFPKGTRYRYKSYNQQSSSIERPNLLNQSFQTDNRNKIWVGDITYVPTKKGVLYLAVFLDIYSRKVSGWSMGRNMKDSLVMDAFMQAYGRERPKEGLIVHTDQGSQFTSGNFQTLLRTHGAVSSVSRKGNPYDNALMESFYRTIKRELV